MATGIVEVFAKAGFRVRYVTRGDEKVARVRAAIELSLEKAVLRGKLDEAARDAALATVTGSSSLDDLADRDLVIEAVVEELTVKKALFATLDEICKPGAILATTTSRCRSSSVPRPRRAPATSSACTSSTRRRS
jgi:3-hydroxybutyryl-CoA dehydrogenase